MTGHTSPTSPGEGEVVARLAQAQLEGLADEWNALAVAAGSIFSTWDWAVTWWTHFGAGRELLLHDCRTADGRLLAVLPLYAWHERRPRVIRFLGHGPADELGPIHLVGDKERTAGCLRTALDMLEWDVFLGEQLPGEDDWSARLGGQSWRRESSPVLRVPGGGWEEYLASRSSNFRQQLRRKERAIAGTGTVVFRLADEASLARDLDLLFALHGARWGGRRTDFFDTPFHRELARRALARGWLRLWFLEVDGRPVAAWHGFQVGAVASYYQAGREPAFDGFSVGLVLLAHTIRTAIDEGAREYRFGRGEEAFKFRFTQHDPGLDSVALARTRLGQAAVAAARAARGVRRAGSTWRSSRRASRSP